jgi:hypothetical protein
MRKPRNKFAVNLCLDQPTIDRLDVIRERAGLSLSAAIRMAVAEYHHLTTTAPTTEPKAA